ncbi:hypothetical protein [Crocosphaera chwakensis]|uniref:Uncharacterized protein n=1 Tax=Crocosphaera chwakensis CCY0110 TaxID=391612 RepID=A3IZ47_9CHRO|nr:hypothetical protein [Crocosphaera chwakensis]EAZ88251.1 hypothetical protein CY0110_14480 [Crocosphaera chwakensis CCY0110]
MRNRKFSNIEFQVNSTIKSSCSFQELQKLNSEMIDFLKGRVLTELVTTGEISQDLVRSVYQEILTQNQPPFKII